MGIGEKDGNLLEEFVESIGVVGHENNGQVVLCAFGFRRQLAVPVVVVHHWILDGTVMIIVGEMGICCCWIIIISLLLFEK